MENSRTLENTRTFSGLLSKLTYDNLDNLEPKFLAVLNGEDCEGLLFLAQVLVEMSVRTSNYCEVYVRQLRMFSYAPSYALLCSKISSQLLHKITFAEMFANGLSYWETPLKEEVDFCVDVNLPDEVVLKIAQFLVDDFHSVCGFVTTSPFKPLSLAVTCHAWNAVINSPLLIKPDKHLPFLHFVKEKAFSKFEASIQNAETQNSLEVARHNYVYVNGCSLFIASLFKFKSLHLTEIKVLYLFYSDKKSVVESLLAFPSENHVLALIGVWKLVGPILDPESKGYPAKIQLTCRDHNPRIK
jgi:hypothetical protein